MKKRILAIATAAVLALGCFATASAAKAPSETSAGKRAQKWIDNGCLDVDEIHLGDYKGATDDWKITKLEALQDGDLTVYAMLTHLAAQYPKDKCIRAFNIEADDADVDDPVLVTIADIDIKGNKIYALCHMDTKTGEWDRTSAKYVSHKDGLAKFNITKASPFALMETKTAQAAATTSKTAAAATTGKTAAKTGEV